jgi:hypothetical protein
MYLSRRDLGKLGAWISSRFTREDNHACQHVVTVKVDISLRVAKEEAAGIGGDWFGLSGKGNLPSLLMVDVRLFYCSGVTVGEATQARASVENAFRAHSNCPTVHISSWPHMPQGT